MINLGVLENNLSACSNSMYDHSSYNIHIQEHPFFSYQMHFDSRFEKNTALGVSDLNRDLCDSFLQIIVKA